jgi:rod shape-determining protein MreD
MRRALVSVLAVAAAVVLQLTVVNRLPLPGGAGPDLVLITVAALAVTGGPMAGVLTGFFGGLALDIAPPGSHLTGEYALVFCLVGYACGLAGAMGERAPLSEVALTAVGAAVGEALQAGLGVMVSDPRVTWPAIRHVLPYAVVYDVLLTPFVLWIVATLALRSEPAEEGPLTGGQAARGARELVTPGALRLAADGPRLRLASSGGRLAAAGPAPATGKREPRLDLSGSRGGTSFLSRTGMGTPNGHSPAFNGRTPKVGFARSRGGLVGGGALGPSLFADPRFGGSRPGGRFAGGAGPRNGWLAGGSRSGGAGGGSLLGGSAGGRPRGRAVPGGKAVRGKALRGGSLTSLAARGGNPLNGKASLGGKALRGKALRGGSVNGGAKASLGTKTMRGKALRGGSVNGGGKASLGTKTMRGKSLHGNGVGLRGSAGLGSTGLGGASRARATTATPQFRKHPGAGFLAALMPWRRSRQRLASPSRGWLNAKPQRRTWQRKSPGRGWLSRTPGPYSQRRGHRPKIGGHR